MIPSFLQDVIEPNYWADLSHAAASGDYTAIEQKLNTLSAQDPWMRPYAAEKGTRYYKPFVQTVVPKILPAIKKAINNSKPPEISVSFDEIDATRKRLGLKAFGSPQDVLYGFTSERYAKWGSTVHGLGFQSACMSEPTRAVLTMAPRYLSLGNPNVEVRELPGTISTDFHETNQAIFGDMPFLRRYRLFCKVGNISDMSSGSPNLKTLRGIVAQLGIVSPTSTERLEINRQILLRQITKFLSSSPTNRIIANFLTASKPSPARVSQEQLVLKYVTEGNYLQKILDGHRVEHIQSNVKMVPNVLRDNKCEVDAIYRVVGHKRILLLEAKGKNRISRAQLYGVYETFRSRIPLDWDLDIVAAMLTDPSSAQRTDGVSKCIDLVEIGLSPQLADTFTERLLRVGPLRHYRWLIH